MEHITLIEIQAKDIVDVPEEVITINGLAQIVEQIKNQFDGLCLPVLRFEE